jgi:gluconolactonase
MEMEEESVYRIDPDGSVTRILSQPAFQQPNGIALSPDDKTLYIVDHNIRPGGNRRIWAFGLEDDRTPVNQRLVYDFGVGRAGDGLRVDRLGNLWTAAGVALPKRAGESAVNPPGIYVLTPEGKLLGIIPIPEDQVTNMTFGGPDKKTLYVTAGKTLFQIQIKVSGWSVFP